MEEEKKQVGDSSPSGLATFSDSVATRSGKSVLAKNARQNDKVGGIVSKKTMDVEINKAILNERKRTQDAIAAYQDVEKYTGSFNMAGMSESEIYQYAYEVLTGEKVKTADAKPSFKAYMKARYSYKINRSERKRQDVFSLARESRRFIRGFRGFKKSRTIF